MFFLLVKLFFDREKGHFRPDREWAVDAWWDPLSSETQ